MISLARICIFEEGLLKGVVQHVHLVGVGIHCIVAFRASDRQRRQSESTSICYTSATNNPSSQLQSIGSPVNSFFSAQQIGRTRNTTHITRGIIGTDALELCEHTRGTCGSMSIAEK